MIRDPSSGSLIQERENLSDRDKGLFYYNLYEIKLVLSLKILRWWRDAGRMFVNRNQLTLPLINLIIPVSFQLLISNLLLPPSQILTILRTEGSK